MVDGLGFAETLPGPLIKVTQFVGFLGAWRSPEPFSPVTSAVLGSALATWVTFVPPMLLIFAGAPFVEQLRANKRLSGALAAITAAVVGVILNLTRLVRAARAVPLGDRDARRPAAVVRVRPLGNGLESRVARAGGRRADLRPAPRPDRAGGDHGRAGNRGTIAFMSAYLIGEIEVTDPAAYEDYRKQVLAVVTQYGGRFLVRGGKVDPKEGGWNPKRIVVLEFPSMAQAQKWYGSPEYAPLIKLRQKAGEGKTHPRRRRLENERASCDALPAPPPPVFVALSSGAESRRRRCARRRCRSAGS